LLQQAKSLFDLLTEGRVDFDFTGREARIVRAPIAESVLDDQDLMLHAPYFSPRPPIALGPRCPQGLVTKLAVTLEQHYILPAPLEKAKAEKEAHGEFASACPGYGGAQDTFYVDTLKGVGRIYQQPFIDTYGKVAVVKLYDPKTPLSCAELLNDRVVPFFESPDIPLVRILTDRGTEYCGSPERQEYELYLLKVDRMTNCDSL
jgi:hypothetical protein